MPGNTSSPFTPEGGRGGGEGGKGDGVASSVAELRFVQVCLQACG